MNTVRHLAIEIHDAIRPNASLADIEKRVWRLKLRNIPDGRIRSIIEDEYSQSQPGDAQIIVEYLPPEYNRQDWH